MPVVRRMSNPTNGFPMVFVPARLAFSQNSVSMEKVSGVRGSAEKMCRRFVGVPQFAVRLAQGFFRCLERDIAKTKGLTGSMK
jgi:hypothetical protein